MSAESNKKIFLQRGNTLIVSLIFLLLLTIIGVGAMRTATLQERMAGNSRDSNIAFQAAEAALRDAETYLANNYFIAAFASNTNGLFDCQSSCTLPVWTDRTTSSSWKTISTSISDQNNTLPRQPEYFIEKLPTTASTGGSLGARGGVKRVSWFRITARGFGSAADPNTTSMVVLQSYYRAD